MHEGIKDIESKLSFVILPLFALAQNRLSKKEVHSIFQLFSYSVVLACLLAVLLSYFKTGQLLTNQELAKTIGLHASYLSLYAAFALFFFVQKALQVKKLLPIIAAMLLSLCLLFLSARMVLLATTIAFASWVVFFQFSIKRLLLLFAAVGIIVIGIVSIEGARVRFKEAFDKSERVEFGNVPEGETVKNYGGKAIRLAIWYCITDLMVENAWVGVGAGDVHENLQKSYKEHEFQLAWQFNNYNTHNLFFETIIAVGFLGVLLICAMFFVLFQQAIRAKDMLYFCFTVLFFLFALIEACFNVQKGFVFLLTITLLLFMNHSTKTNLVSE